MGGTDADALQPPSAAIHGRHGCTTVDIHVIKSTVKIIFSPHLKKKIPLLETL